MKINTVDWKLLGSCNLGCLHCYGPPKHQKHLPLRSLLKIINRFAELKVRRVVLTGGEPLLVKGIDIVLSKLAEHNISIALSTNTCFFGKYQRFIEEYVYALNIPIDGPTPEIHSLSRMDTSSFYSCLELLRYYRTNPARKPTLIRVGTVYSNATAGTFVQMANLLEPFASVISAWKIYELMEYEFQPELRARIRPKHGDFEREMVGLLTATSFSSKIIPSPASGRDRAYFMVNPLGQLVLPIETDGVTKETILGNFVDDHLHALIKKWERDIDLNKYNSNHEGHYGS